MSDTEFDPCRTKLRFFLADSRHRLRDRWVPVVIVIVAVAPVALTLTDPGLVWDETIYQGFAVQYVRWFAEPGMPRFSAEALRRFWWQGQVHPPLVKLLMAASFAAFDGVLSFTASGRVPNMLMFGGTAAVLFLLARIRSGFRTGLFSAAFFVLMPRCFGHAHFGAMDIPMTFVWLLVVYSFVRALRSTGWVVACGVLFGLALLTKVNALFLPFVLVGWGACFYGRRVWRPALSMACIGPVMFVAFWPALWADPFGGSVSYLVDKANRMPIEAYYLGRVFAHYDAPWHYPIVLTLVTVPSLTIVAACIGLARALRRLRRYPELVLCAINVAVLIGIMIVPGVPKYDGARLFLPAFPFIAWLAGRGLASVCQWAETRRLVSRCRATCLAGLLLACHAFPIAWVHPYELSYYSLFAGGLRGATRLGFETTYWGDAITAEALDFVNRRCPSGGKAAFFPVGSLVPGRYRVTGQLRPDIEVTADIDAPGCDLLVLVMRQGKFTPTAGRILRERKPAWETTRSGVPLCRIYDLRENGK